MESSLSLSLSLPAPLQLKAVSQGICLGSGRLTIISLSRMRVRSSNQRNVKRVGQPTGLGRQLDRVRSEIYKQLASQLPAKIINLGHASGRVSVNLIYVARRLLAAGLQQTFSVCLKPFVA